jgi:hypothetical protein
MSVVQEELHRQAKYMSVVQEELHRQAKYLRTLEWSNIEMSAELNVLRERYTSVEVERAVLLIFPLPRS